MSWVEHKKKPSFCILPFVHGATLTDGRTPLCCVAQSSSGVNLNQDTLKEYWNSDYLNSVRRKMLEGERVNDCSRCYKEEESGCRSHRVVENKAWEEKLGMEALDQLLSEVEPQGSITAPLLSVDLRLGNTCNLQCIMCQPKESSKWKGASTALMKEIRSQELFHDWNRKSQISTNQFEWYKNESFWNHLKQLLPSLREIIIGGGEPMLIKEHLDFVQFCASSGEAEHIHLRYHTNMTQIPEEMIPYWEKFERVEFLASLDGLGAVGEYIRYPSNWELVKKNLLLIDSLKENIELRILYSVNALNMHHMPSFVQWVKEQSFKKRNNYPTLQGFICPGIVHWPQYLCVDVLPPQLKSQITKSWESMKNLFEENAFDKYEGVLHLMNSEDQQDRLPLLMDYVHALDRSRGTDFYSTFPELCEYLLVQS